MRYREQFLLELRNLRRQGLLIGALMIGVLYTRGFETVHTASSGATPAWLPAVYFVTNLVFAAYFVIFILGAYSVIEDKLNDVYDRLFAYPEPFTRLVFLKAMPIAVCGFAVASVVGVAFLVQSSQVSVLAFLGGMALVAILSPAIALGVTSLYLWIDQLRVGTFLLMGVTFAIPYASTRLIGANSSPIVIVLSCIGVLLALYLVVYLSIAWLDAERIIFA